MIQEARIRNRGARFLMITASLVIVVAGMREIKPIALPLVVAIFLSVLSAPLLGWLVEHRIPRVIAVFVTVLSNIGVVVLLLTLVGSSVSNFANAVPVYQQNLEDKARNAFTWLEGMGINTSELNWLQDLPDEGDLDEIVSTSEAGETRASENPIRITSLGGIAAATLRTIASLMTMTFLVFFIMVFILLEAAQLPRKLEVAFGWRAKDLRRTKKMMGEVQHYLRIKTFISLLTGLAALLWVLWLGIDFPLLWGTLAFVLNFIPSLGSIIASFPAVLLAWVQLGTGPALATGIGYLVINIVLGNFAEPHLMGRQLGISTLVVFLSLIFWGWVWGPVGMLLAVPLTMMLKIVLEHTEDLRWMSQLMSARPRALDPGPRAMSVDSSVASGSSNA